jgi:hypothetical protein
MYGDPSPFGPAIVAGTFSYLFVLMRSEHHQGLTNFRGDLSSVPRSETLSKNMRETLGFPAMLRIPNYFFHIRI